jgi:hypothetical protein
MNDDDDEITHVIADNNNLNNPVEPPSIEAIERMDGGGKRLLSQRYSVILLLLSVRSALLCLWM